MEAHGDTSGLWFQGLMARMAFPQAFVWGEYAGFAGADTLAAKRYFAKGPHRMDSTLGNPGTEFLYAGGGLTTERPGFPFACPSFGPCCSSAWNELRQPAGSAGMRKARSN